MKLKCKSCGRLKKKQVLFSVVSLLNEKGETWIRQMCKYMQTGRKEATETESVDISIKNRNKEKKKKCRA